MQFLVNAADVRIDRRHADVQALGNLLVKVTTGKEFQHFVFARGERLSGAAGEELLNR